MDAETVAIYDQLGRDWTAQRAPVLRELAASAASDRGPVLDAGCGPGWYAPDLGPVVVSMDASATMLDQVENPLRVLGDLAALPFRRSAFAGAAALNSYVHLPKPEVPIALADLHRSLTVGARVSLALFNDAAEWRRSDHGPFAGRGFSGWLPTELPDLCIGAGFDVDAVTERTDLLGDLVEVRMRRARTLPDTVGPNLQMLVCGLNPSLHAADAGVGFVTANNRFWPAAHAAGLTSGHRDPWLAYAEGVGMTDLVKRATTKASELRSTEYREGMRRLTALVEWLRPRVICFVGLAGYRAAFDRRASAGPQAALGGVPVYVMPSTSGLNAATSLEELTSHLRAARELGKAG